jgi:hypothetical protein
MPVRARDHGNDSDLSGADHGPENLSEDEDGNLDEDNASKYIMIPLRLSIDGT